MKVKNRLYLAADGWRWQTKASNGKVTGASTEGYINLGDAHANMLRTAKALSEPPPSPKPGVKTYQWTVDV